MVQMSQLMGRYDVVIQLRIGGEVGFFPCDIIDSFAEIDVVLRDVERDLASLAQQEFKLSNDAIQGLLEKQSSFDGKRFIIGKAYPGSLVFEAVVGASFILLLRYTLLESVKAGWTQTDVHSKIEAFVKSAIDNYPGLIGKHWQIKKGKAKIYTRYGRRMIRLKTWPLQEESRATLGSVRKGYDSLIKRIEMYWEGVRWKKEGD